MTNIKTAVKADKSPKIKCIHEFHKPGKNEKAGSCGDPKEKASVLTITVHFMNDKLCTSLNIKYVLCIQHPLLASKRSTL